MNDANTNRRLAPTSVIVIYNDTRRSNFYLEHREVKHIAGKLTLMSPVPLADDVLKDVAKSYMDTNAFEMDFGGMISDHLLYCSNKPGKTIVMWYRPTMRRSLNFSASLKIEGDTTVTVPATLYLVINKELFIYAIQNDSRPTKATKLYHAPFFNIYTEGNVCMGTAHVGSKANNYEKEAERFERAFYMAEQNGGNGARCKTDLKKLWAELIKKEARSFPSAKELVPHPKYPTLNHLITDLIPRK